jgi:hypothetical protein
MKRRPPELKILPLEGEARSPEIFPLDETERPLPGEGGLPSLTKIVDEDWSGLASCFRKAFSVSSFPKDLVTLLVALLDGVDLLALACVSKDCLAFARGVSRCRFGADLSDLSAILTGKELLLDSTDSRGNVVLFRCWEVYVCDFFLLNIIRDGTFCALSHGAGYASMGNWTWDASLIGSWKKMDSSLLGNPALRFPKRILLEAKEWKGRARDEWYARSEHAPRDWKAASPKNLSSRVSLQSCGCYFCCHFEPR